MLQDSKLVQVSAAQRHSSSNPPAATKEREAIASLEAHICAHIMCIYIYICIYNIIYIRIYVIYM